MVLVIVVIAVEDQSAVLPVEEVSVGMPQGVEFKSAVMVEALPVVITGKKLIPEGGI